MKRALTAALVTAALTASAPAAEKVVAEVNGKKITEKEVNAFMESLPESYKRMKNDPQFKKIVIENMVKEELLLQQAQKEGIDKDPKVQAEIERARRRIIIQHLLRKHVKEPKVEVTEKEAKEFYQKNKQQFVDANGKPIPYEQLKPFIIQSLKQQKQEQALNTAIESYIESLKKENKVVIK